MQRSQVGGRIILGPSQFRRIAGSRGYRSGEGSGTGGCWAHHGGIARRLLDRPHRGGVLRRQIGAGGQQGHALRGRKLWLGAGDDRYSHPLGKLLGDKRNVGTATHRGDRVDVRRMNTVAFHGVLNGVDQVGERAAQVVLEFGAGEPNVGGDSGKRHRYRGRGLAGEPLLGQPALIAQSGQRADRRGALGILVQVGEDLRQEHLVNLLAGELDKSDGLPDLLESPCRIGQGDAGARAAEIAHHHDAAVGYARPRGQRLEGSARVGDQLELPTARSERGNAVDRVPERGDGLRAPMRGDRGGQRRRRGEFGSGGRVGDQYAHGFGECPFGPVNRSVRRHDADGVADPADESGERQPWMARYPNLGWTVLMQGEDRTAHHGLALRVVGCRDQLSGADRQSQCVGHTYPFVLRRCGVSPRSPTVGDDGRHTP